MSTSDAVLVEVIELLQARGLGANDIARLGMAVTGGAIGDISQDREILEKNIQTYTEVFQLAARDAFHEPEEN